MKKKLIILAFLIILAGGVSAQSTLFSVTVKYDNGNISVKKVSTYEGYKPVIKEDSGNYSVEILSDDGSKIEERRFDFSRTAYVENEGEIKLNETTSDIVFEKSEDFSTVVVRRGNKKLVERNLKPSKESRNDGKTTTGKNKNQKKENNEQFPLVPTITVLLLISIISGFIIVK